MTYLLIAVLVPCVCVGLIRQAGRKDGLVK